MLKNRQCCDLPSCAHLFPFTYKRRSKGNGLPGQLLSRCPLGQWFCPEREFRGARLNHHQQISRGALATGPVTNHGRMSPDTADTPHAAIQCGQILPSKGVGPASDSTVDNLAGRPWVITVRPQAGSNGRLHSVTDGDRISHCLHSPTNTKKLCTGRPVVIVRAREMKRGIRAAAYDCGQRPRKNPRRPSTRSRRRVDVISRALRRPPASSRRAPPRRR